MIIEHNNFCYNAIHVQLILKVIKIWKILYNEN